MTSIYGCSTFEHLDDPVTTLFSAQITTAGAELIEGMQKSRKLRPDSMHEEENIMDSKRIDTRVQSHKVSSIASNRLLLN